MSVGEDLVLPPLADAPPGPSAGDVLRERWAGWVSTHGRQLFWLALLLALPYLVVCNAIGLFIARGLLSGGCGG